MMRPPKAVLGDLNAELINAFRVVRDSVEELIVSLERHRYDRDHYYQVRSLDPALLNAATATTNTITQASNTRPRW